MKFFYSILFLSLIIFSIGLVPTYATNITIIEIESNPAGADTGKEWARLFNSGKDSVNLSGWSMNSTHDKINSHLLSGNISACNDLMISFPNQFLDDENESLILYDDDGNVVDSTSKITDKVNNDITWKTKTPKCEYVPNQSFESDPTPKPSVDSNIGSISEKSGLTTESMGEKEKINSRDLGVEIQMNDNLIEELAPILPYLVIIIASIIVGVTIILMKSNRKNKDRPDNYEKPDKSVIEKIPMMQKFQDMQTETQSDYIKNLKPDQVIENKLWIISKLEENKIGDGDKLKEIKKSLITNGSFTKEDNLYLETKYDEYQKMTKSRPED